MRCCHRSAISRRTWGLCATCRRMSRTGRSARCVTHVARRTRSARDQRRPGIVRPRSRRVDPSCKHMSRHQGQWPTPTRPEWKVVVTVHRRTLVAPPMDAAHHTAGGTPCTWCLKQATSHIHPALGQTRDPRGEWTCRFSQCILLRTARVRLCLELPGCFVFTCRARFHLIKARTIAPRASTLEVSMVMLVALIHCRRSDASP